MQQRDVFYSLSCDWSLLWWPCDHAACFHDRHVFLESRRLGILSHGKRTHPKDYLVHLFRVSRSDSLHFSAQFGVSAGVDHSQSQSFRWTHCSVFSLAASGIDFIFRYHLLSCIKDVYIHCRGTNNLSDLVCRILLRLTSTGRFLYGCSLFVEEDCEAMYKEGGIGLLFAVAKSCVGNEETIRMCMQVLRVIAFMGSSFRDSPDQ